MSGKKPEHMYALIGLPETEAEEGESKMEFRPAGKGMLNVPSILEAAKDAGAQWIIVEQDSPSLGMDQLECARAGIEYLKSLNW